MNSLEKLKPLGLLLLRWGLGVIFIYHGYPKLIHTKEFMEQVVRIGFPSFFAYIVGVLEFFGGALLIVGLFTRVAGLLLAFEMLIAIWKVNLPPGGIYTVEKYQFPLAVGVGAFALAAVGAGLISLDHVFFREGGTFSRRGKRKER
jgi:putative oxidoreductase